MKRLSGFNIQIMNSLCNLEGNASLGWTVKELDCNKVEVIEKDKSESITFREEVVPGAILPPKIPEECTVKQLQRWLLCRGAKTTGKKIQLVQR